MRIVLIRNCSMGNAGDVLLVSFPQGESLVRQKLARPYGWRESVIGKGGHC